MKLFILPLFSYLSSTLANPAPDPPSKLPNILQASSHLGRDQCCKVFRQIWGSFFTGPSDCDDACVCDWLDTNLPTASWSPWVRQSADAPRDWSWCTPPCGPSVVTLSRSLLSWTGTSWAPTNTNTAIPTSTLISTGSTRATLFVTLISTVMLPTKTSDIGVIRTTDIGVTTKVAEFEKERIITFGTGTDAWGANQTLGFTKEGPVGFAIPGGGLLALGL